MRTYVSTSTSGRWRAIAALLLGIATLVAAPSASTAQTALRLGPTNTTTYVTFGSASALGLSTFTIETWFNRQGTGVAVSTGANGITGFVPLLTKGAAQAEASNVDANYLLGINTAGNVIAADFEQFGTCTGGTGNCTTAPYGPGCSCNVGTDCQSGTCANAGLNHPVSGVTPIASNIWYHAAATYDGTTLRLYLNGQLEAAQTFAAGVTPRSDSIQHAGLGTTLTSTGAASGFFDGTLDEGRIWNGARTQAQIRSTMNVQNPSDASLVARWGLDEGAGTAVGDSAGTPQNGTVTGANFSWTTGAPFDVAPCAGTSTSLLRFDGTNDYVTFGTAAKLGLSSFTIETWFRREGVGVGNTTGTAGIGGTGGPAGSLVPLVAKGAPEADGSNVDANYILGINTTGNVLAADFEEGAAPSPSPGLNHPLVGTTAVTDNNWHHAAATYDSATRDWRLYLDGALEASATLGAGVVPRFDSIQPAGLATMQKSALAPGQLGFFAGLLDEARIWSVARTQAQIQADRFQQLTAGTGLVARWDLGEGSGTTTADSLAPAATGTLTNGPLWVAGGSLFDANGACDDGTFCNGPDTCSGAGAGLRCSTHAGDPCVGGPECNDVCNEAAENCAVTSGTGCTADSSPCTLDECDGLGSCGHPAGNAGTLCRAGSGDACDPDELCDGSNQACPADVVAPGTTVCNAGSGDVCDPDELCPGTPGGTCPTDTVAPAGTVCRPGSGDLCDPDEQCPGVADAACPGDVVAAATTVCNAGSGDMCDPDEHCTAVAGQACPSDTVAPAATICRGAAGTCDVAERCTGTADQACPSDSVADASVVCRSSAGACDLAETCDGTSAACPPDSKSTATCRASAGACDVAETCDGASDVCPPDGFEPASTVCRTAASPCDVAETCTGSSAACPADSGLPDSDADTVCDAIDNCPADPNTGQDDDDGDLIGNACDPCTGGAAPTKHKLTLSKLLAPAGDDKLSFKGQATLDFPFAPSLDPASNGVRFLVRDAAGTVVVDATVAGGAYDVGTKTGWKVNGSATAWTYKNPGTQPQGITTVGVKTVPSTPGLLKVKAKGKNGTYPVATANLPLRATLVLDPPTAETGECIEATWTATPPALPSCTTVAAGNVVKCK